MGTIKRMRALHALPLAAAVLLALAAAGSAVLVYSGAYNVGASWQHTQAVYSMLELALHRSVQLRARNIETPLLDDPRRIARGAGIYRDNCVQCHGAPGVAPGDIGKGMQPVPGPLIAAMQRWQPREVYWLTRHGIKMSGMPAWEFRMDDAALWDVVAFVQRLPDLTPNAYAELAGPAPSAAWQGNNRGAQPMPGTASTPATEGNVERGRQALHQYACHACHVIPGVVGSASHVGPPLAGLAGRNLIAGRLANTPQNMRRWLQHPQAVKPLTAMPSMGVTDAHAADMAAYLATLR
ncbi:MAG: Di-heme cytochrome c [Polaromonas sp.]|nr:Di-heme cytochrome c [Polaromonas sp.]